MYLVHHLGIRKRMALKVLRAEVMRNPAVLARFEREAMAAAHFDHPNVAAAHDYGRAEEGSFYLVLEYVEGQELRAALEQAKGPLPLGRVLFIARQLASALLRAHELGIVHRDLKPENIMLVKRDGHSDFVKVLDFGLAQVSRRIADELQNQGPSSQAEERPAATTSKLTKFGDIFGTPAYMAPEQSVGDSTDARTDLYALGVILYELITGRRPFVGTSLLALVQDHLSTPPPPMSEVAPDVQVPRPVEDLVQRLLAKNPDERIQHPQELLDSIDQLVAAHKLTWTPSGAASSPGGTSSGAFVPAAASVPSVPGVQVASVPPVAAAATTGATGSHPAVAEKKSEAPPAKVPGEPAGPAAGRAALAQAQSAGGQPREALPAPTRRLPRWPLLLLLPLALLPLLLIGKGPREPKPTTPLTPKVPTPPKAVNAPAPPTATSASQATIDAAVAQGPAAIEALVNQFPTDPRLLRAQVRNLIGRHRPVEAMRTIAKLAALDPETGRDSDIAQALVSALQGDEESMQAATALMEQDLGEAGVELLYDLTVKQTGARWKTRLNQSLTRPAILARATPPLRAAIDLRAAKRCEAKRELLPRVKKIGDRRSLVQLQSLTATKGCGFLGLQDCWSCLRRSSALADAIATLEARTQAAENAKPKPR